MTICRCHGVYASSVSVAHGPVLIVSTVMSEWKTHFILFAFRVWGLGFCSFVVVSFKVFLASFHKDHVSTKTTITPLFTKVFPK